MITGLSYNKINIKSVILIISYDSAAINWAVYYRVTSRTYCSHSKCLFQRNPWVSVPVPEDTPRRTNTVVPEQLHSTAAVECSPPVRKWPQESASFSRHLNPMINFTRLSVFSLYLKPRCTASYSLWQRLNVLFFLVSICLLYGTKVANDQFTDLLYS